MEEYSKELFKLVAQLYEIDSAKPPAVLLPFFDTSALVAKQASFSTLDGQERFVKELRAVLSTLQRKPPETEKPVMRVANIAKYLAVINLVPRELLDIGAGDGKITLGLKATYNLSTANTFAIDRKLPNIPGLTALQYVENNKIPLQNSSVDLIVFYNVLHHVPTSTRQDLLREAERVLSSTGAIVIREHDDLNTILFRLFLDAVHMFYYAANNEEIDPMELMTHQNVLDRFQQLNMRSVGFYPNLKNPQRLYYEVFQKNVVSGYRPSSPVLPPVLKNYPVTIVEQKGNVTKALFKTKDVAEANMLRRAILTEVETYAIDIVVFQENHSARHDELLALRFGQCVIDNVQYEKILDPNHDTQVRLEVEGPKVVTTDDIPLLPFAKTTPIITLLAGQRIICDLVVKKGIGRTHVKWSPVSTCVFREAPEGFDFVVKELGMLPGSEIFQRGYEKILKAASRPAADIFSQTLLPKNVEVVE